MTHPCPHPPRPAKASEALAVQALWRSAHTQNLDLGFPFWAAEASLPEVEARLAQGHLWLAEGPQGQAWACVEVKPGGGPAPEDTFWPPPDTPPAWPGDWILKLLCVAPEAQGLGLGRVLVAHAEAIAWAGGAQVLALDTPAEHPSLPAWYHRLGYREAGQVAWATRSYRSVVLVKARP